MKKINEKYQHESGITAKVWFEEKQSLAGVDIRKSVRLQGTDGKIEFVFNKSKPETIRKVGKAFIEIADFIEKL